jgi:hypothetical protein
VALLAEMHSTTSNSIWLAAAAAAAAAVRAGASHPTKAYRGAHYACCILHILLHIIYAYCISISISISISIGTIACCSSECSRLLLQL